MRHTDLLHHVSMRTLAFPLIELHYDEIVLTNTYLTQILRSIILATYTIQQSPYAVVVQLTTFKVGNYWGKKNIDVDDLYALHIQVNVHPL